MWALAAIRVRALVLVDMRPAAGTVVMAHRRSPVAITAAVDDPIDATTPLASLPNVVALSG